jgi:uncharacterized membrane protein
MPLAGLEHAVAPWAELYANSARVKAVVVFVHVAGTMTAGGFAMAADRAALRAGRLADSERLHLVRELGEIHRPVLLALLAVVLSGVAMLLGDLETLLPSIVFWVKMGLFVLLLVNGVTVQRAERRLSADAPGAPWGPLRSAAWRSIGLWLAVVFFGALLSSA